MAELGRFQATSGLPYDRGDRVVVRTDLGLELGSVLCPATARQSRVLSGPVGELLRRAGPCDEDAARHMAERALELFETGRRLITELALPLELLDYSCSTFPLLA